MGQRKAPCAFEPHVKEILHPVRGEDDLISIGTIGLIKGISTFKPEKGARLATYAARCVENAMLT